MYKTSESEHLQLSFFQFNASCGMQLDSQNEWVKAANRLPWKAWESQYFSTAKRRNGMGLITKKREDTSLTTIALSVLATNTFGSFKLAVEELEIESSTSA